MFSAQNLENLRKIDVFIGFLYFWMDSCTFGWILALFDGFLHFWMDSCTFGWILALLDPDCRHIGSRVFAIKVPYFSPYGV